MLMSMWQSGMPESQGGYLKTFFLRIPEITCTSRTPGFSKEIRYFKSFFFSDVWVKFVEGLFLRENI